MVSYINLKNLLCSIKLHILNVIGKSPSLAVFVEQV